MIFKTTKPKLKHYNIPPTDENHELLRKAKAAIGESYPDQALELLSTIKLKTLDIEITALNARLAELERTQRFGTESYDTETREHNKINKSIIFLITALEKEIAQSFEFYDKIRAALKSRYETRLSQKLSNRQPVNLRLAPSTAGTTPQAANTFVQYSEGQIRGKLAEYYKDAHGRLLLVGVPGAGKTTLLLQLELELLEQETTRIPVILNLARWSSTFPTLEAWIQEILPSELGLTINKKMAGDLITQDRLILLLDGLDEVKEEDRETCLEAIGVYGEDPDRHFIISSRIEEYKAAAKDAPVNSQVEVGTLKYEQLIEQLEKTEQNQGSKRLLSALKEDDLLREIAEVPFYFNALQLLFARGKYLHEFDFSAQDVEGRKKEIGRGFVFEMLSKFTTKDYDAQKSSKYLGFFASRLKRANLVDFELIHLQYWWYRLSKWEAIIGNFSKGLVLGLSTSLFLCILFGLFYGLIFTLMLNSGFGLTRHFAREIDRGLYGGLSNSLMESLIVGLVFGQVISLLAGLLFGLTKALKYSINIIPTKEWNLIKTTKQENLIFGLVFGLIFSIALGLFLGLFYSMFETLAEFLFIIMVFTVGLGLVTGLALSLIIGLIGELNYSSPIIETRENITWNWNKTISLKKLIFALICGFYFMLLSFLIKRGTHLVEDLVIGLSGGFFLVLFKDIIDQLKNHYSVIQINEPFQRFRASSKTMYFSIFQHWHLRHLLHKKGLLPKKLVPFLNDMVACNILETTGASWRFRHRILQDYFADQWVETEFEPEQK